MQKIRSATSGAEVYIVMPGIPESRLATSGSKSYQSHYGPPKRPPPVQRKITVMTDDVYYREGSRQPLVAVLKYRWFD